MFHLTESSSSAHDASTPAAPFTPLVPLRLELHPDTTTGTVDTVLSSASCTAPFELDLEGFLVSTPEVCEAGTTLTIDGVTVSPTGDLTLRAGQRVRFVTDFSVSRAASSRPRSTHCSSRNWDGTSSEAAGLRAGVEA